jgi:hypothetical protein
MDKSNLTKQELENAISRIQSGETKRIPSTRKLSVRAVEDEAGLGDGSAYYYKDVIDKIKQAKNNTNLDSNTIIGGSSDVILRDKLKKETQIKNKYRIEIRELKERLTLMTKTHNELALEVNMYKQRVENLEAKINLKRTLV